MRNVFIFTFCTYLNFAIQLATQNWNNVQEYLFEKVSSKDVISFLKA